MLAYLWRFQNGRENSSFRHFKPYALYRSPSKFIMYVFNPKISLTNHKTRLKVKNISSIVVVGGKGLEVSRIEKIFCAMYEWMHKFFFKER